MDMTDYLPHLQWIDGQESRMIDLLTQWANVNSGTQNLQGLNEVLTLFEEEFGKLGGENERITLDHSNWKILPALVFKYLGQGSNS
jgi:hypothetical protein